MQYGLFSYETENIGDEIQSIAARRFLPKVDYYVNRDDIDSTVFDKPTKIIMNGWFTHKPENWPPKNNNILPLLISMHIEQDAYAGNIQKAFLSEESINFLNKYGAVGCRDISTYDFLQENNIDAFFSGCLTLTLVPEKTVKKSNFILLVDLPEKTVNIIKNRTSRPVITINTNYYQELTREQRNTIAKYWLTLYQSAHYVISPRLHAILPSLALGTPVLAIAGRDPKRYSGLLDFVNSIDEDVFYAEECHKIDLDHPNNNPKTYLKYRDLLIKKCSDFTGYDSKQSYLRCSFTDFVSSPSFVDAISALTELSYTYGVILNEKLNLQEANRSIPKPGVRQSASLLTQAIIRKIKS